MMTAKKHAVLLKVASVDAVMKELFPKPGDRILIINSGTGDLPLALLKKFTAMIDVVCTDHTSDMIDLTRGKTKDFSNIKVQRSKINELHFAENSFDIVMTLNDVEFISNKPRFMQNITRVLKPKGCVLMTSYCPVGVMAWFRELDWKVFDRDYFGRVDRKKTKILFSEAGLKLLRTKKMRVFGKQEVFYAKGVKI